MKYTIQNAAITLQGHTLLNEVNIDIIDKSHIGIVGRNGVGKTTLLKALIDNELFEEGIAEKAFEIKKIGDFSIGYLEQINFKNDDITLIEEIKKYYQEFINMEKKLEEILKRMEKDTSSSLIQEYTDLLDKYELLGGYFYKKEYEVMLRKFGFSNNDKNRLISSFSGGERTKLSFILLLLSKPDILLLDEPTNHLDIETILWLEEYLKNYQKAFVIVSHDRMFLNNIVNTIYDISYGKVVKYVGNYENFEKMKKQNYDLQLKNFEAQQKEIKRLREIYERFRYKPSKAAMALSKLHMIERMELIDKPQKMKEKSFRINLNKIEKSGRSIINCRNLEIGYDSCLATLNLEIESGMRLAIIGANGSGKSTILKTINGLIKPLSGTISYGYNVKIGYFDQNLEMINDNYTVLEEFKASFNNILDNEARKILGAFLFSGKDVEKQISNLSGGERVRLLLCKILYNKPNFLILDEPTNHLDIESKQQLEKILEDYKGTILFVSHDRYFIKKIATSLLVFEDNNLRYYNRGYTDYINEIGNNAEVINKSKILKKQEKDLGKSLNNLKKELNKINKALEEFISQKDILEKELENPEVYSDYLKSNDINRKIIDLNTKINDLEKTWEELADLIMEEEKKDIGN